MGTVAGGGVFGAAAREAVEQALPTPHHGFPLATMLINLSGAFLLGVLLEALVRAGADSGWRRRARLLAGTGFMGAFTTYSTFAVEADLLVRAGRGALAAVYVVATVAGGLVAAAAGIVVASRPRLQRVGGRRRAGRLPRVGQRPAPYEAQEGPWPGPALPVDPDVDEEDRR